MSENSLWPTWYEWPAELCSLMNASLAEKPARAAASWSAVSYDLPWVFFHELNLVMRSEPEKP